MLRETDPIQCQSNVAGVSPFLTIPCHVEILLFLSINPFQTQTVPVFLHFKTNLSAHSLSRGEVYSSCSSPAETTDCQGPKVSFPSIFVHLILYSKVTRSSKCIWFPLGEKLILCFSFRYHGLFCQEPDVKAG